MARSFRRDRNTVDLPLEIKCPHYFNNNLIVCALVYLLLLIFNFDTNINFIIQIS